MKPERVQLKRTKGWRMPDNTVKVTRPTKWGNPYEVWTDSGNWFVSWERRCHWPVDSKADGHTLAVQKFKEDLLKKLTGELFSAEVILHELRGKNLACWCAPGVPCHADVLLELANQ